jgi:hypothetical protein
MKDGGHEDGRLNRVEEAEVGFARGEEGQDPGRVQGGERSAE